MPIEPTVEARPQIPHFYEQIEGWFDFDDIYADMVKKVASGARFVEIGAWLGRSTAFMAVEIANSGKAIEFSVVDTWKGSPNESYHLNVVTAAGGSIVHRFLENMRRGGVDRFVTPLNMTSVEAANQFQDASLDFVFIDGCHEYDAVRNDVCIWKKKVKDGGVLAGHDIEWQGLRAAVQDVLPWSEVSTRRSSWFWVKGVVQRGHWVRRGSFDSKNLLPNHLLFIPCAACLDRLKHAIRSVWSPGIDTIVVDSSSQGLGLDKQDIPPQVGLFRTDKKLSFTQVQNWAQGEARRRGAPWLLFMHADATCVDPQVIHDLLSFCEDMRANKRRVGVVFTAYDALCAFNMEAVEDVGPWDETFEWYGADCDYYHRFRLRGWGLEQWPDSHRVRHEGSASIKHDGAMAAEERRNDEYQRNHYRHKWGGSPGGEQHAVPYNGIT